LPAVFGAGFTPRAITTNDYTLHIAVFMLLHK
jgi:hypothetical protein